MIRNKIIFIVYTFFACQPFFVCAKKILLTGGAGFIGSHVAQALLNRGDDVVIIDNMNDGYSLAIKNRNIEIIKKSDVLNKLRIYIDDICDVEAMESIFNVEKPDVVCHLAARAGVRTSIENPYEFIRSNSLGTVVMLEMAHKFNVRHVVCASSSSVYGDRLTGLFSEQDSCDKQSSPYGATKRMSELLAYVYHHLYGISITNLRFFTVYGPRGRVDMAPFIFMDAIHNDKVITVYGDGSAIRDFTYVDDIVDGIIKAIDNSAGYQILNLGRGQAIILSDFIAIMENVVRKKAVIQYAMNFLGDVPRTHADIAKAQALIGYKPLVSIDYGLAKMYEWYKSEYVYINPGIKRGISCEVNTSVCYI